MSSRNSHSSADAMLPASTAQQAAQQIETIIQRVSRSFWARKMSSALR
jgi:hypothetical protein